MLSDEEIFNSDELIAFNAQLGLPTFMFGKLVRAIESVVTAPLLARIAELERLRAEDHSHALDLAAEIERLSRELEEVRKDAERLTNEQIDAGIKAWFSTDITINEGKDRGHPFRQRMRAAISAAIKEQT